MYQFWFTDLFAYALVCGPTAVVAWRWRMIANYEAWIADNITETYGKCDEATEQMSAAFPELRRVRGHYYCEIWGERAHWWLVAPNGQIVDPTKAQFPSGGLGRYVEWDEAQEAPTGMCPNCGGMCYGGNYCCSEACGRAYVAFCSGAIQ